MERDWGLVSVADSITGPLRGKEGADEHRANRKKSKARGRRGLREGAGNLE